MGHTIREKQKLLARVRRIRGQVEAIERALDGEAGCEQVMHLIAAVRGATAGLMAEVVEDHVRTHLVDAEKHPDALNTEATEQLLDVVHRFSRSSLRAAFWNQSRKFRSRTLSTPMSKSMGRAIRSFLKSMSMRKARRLATTTCGPP